MGEVEPDCTEPHQIEDCNPPYSESPVEQSVRIRHFLTCELLELHICPEMGEVEGDETEDDDSEHYHIAGSPGICLCLAGNSITAIASAGTEIGPGEVASVEDVDEEPECKHRHHHSHNRQGHKVATGLEKTVRTAV